jgi:hypothetical protein
MTMDEIFASAPGVLNELTREFARRGNEEYIKDQESQATAYFFLAIRSASLLAGMARLLMSEARDSIKVLMRGFLESRDLLMTFRFDDQGMRNKIGIWFKGDVGTTWKAEHTRCEGYLDKLGYKGSEFAKKWSQTTTLAHPTRFASQNSVSCVTLWVANPPRVADYYTMMEPEHADYLTSIASLIVLATHDLPGLISLGCDLNRIPNIGAFRQGVFSVVVPILNKRDSDLPPGSYRA